MPKSKGPSQDDLLREAARRLASLGGKARISRLSPEQRRALARKAGKASGAARRKKGASTR
jgi:hypothetical protein